MMDAEEAERYLDQLDLGGHVLNLVGLSAAECQTAIKAWAILLSNSATLAEAEGKAQSTRFDLGRDYRDLRHLITTETCAALQAVERRHFESQFTSC